MEFHSSPPRRYILLVLHFQLNQILQTPFHILMGLACNLCWLPCSNDLLFQPRNNQFPQPQIPFLLQTWRVFLARPLDSLLRSMLRNRLFRNNLSHKLSLNNH
jgi:hypothetical protein